MFRWMREKYFWIIFFILLISLILIRSSSEERYDITWAENLLREIYTPLFSGVSGVKEKISQISVFFEERKQLEETIARLEAENDKLKLENQALREYKMEALRLKNILGFQNDNLEVYNLLPAKVIARKPNNWYQVIIIDKGEKNGVTKDMPVITPEGLVGVVTSTSSYSSYVNLLTDRSVAVGVLIQNTRETTGIVEGTGESNILRMTNIPYYSAIKKNDVIVTSGLSQIYPKGIKVGTVKEVYREAGGILLSADVKPAVDFDKLEEVLIITDFKQVVENVAEENE
ncbi:rod shape-determining protein MreC [Thermosyntropha lipolytica DSM 11003]|uniref:Cell shape-determining protein MreC n=1 Tax=Thermosyntropha lipolytica DSM 11003 TaxID=1123382 RepID=A0A1M5MM80_9FIRM|nr:rod shape-determining protein MreC [Thermosyntropha lipolytica]SHG78490.1 rod shape-determining protein MreC [Thermosyntropha lipolytica DSM 11003]